MYSAPGKLRFSRHPRLIALLALAGLLLSVFVLKPHLAHAAACSAPATSYGDVTGLSVGITSSGTYRVWTRMAAADTTNNTYLLEIDGSSCYTVGGNSVPTYAAGATTYFASGSSNWVSRTSAGAQVDVSLSAGNHTLKLIGNAPNVVIDRVVMTQDLTCAPTGAGDNCATPPDTTPPVVAISAPANNATISATTTATATATDDVLVSKVEFYVDGVLKATDTTGTYTYSINPANFSLGSHTLTAKAYDTSNNSATSSLVSFTIPDTAAPTVSVTAPTAGSTASGTIALGATASDNVGVTKVDFFVDGGSTAVATDTTSPYSGSYSTTGLSNTTHTFTAKAYDAAGNATTSAGIALTVNNQATPPPDTTPPVVAMAHPLAGDTISGTYTVSVTASDASGIKQVQIYIDNVLKTTDTTTPYSFSLDTTALTNGAHTFKAVATDNSTNQNVATSTVVTATVSNVTFLAEDINQDGHVNILDFSLLAAKFGQSGTSLGRADINGDNIVNLLDFSRLASKFGT